MSRDALVAWAAGFLDGEGHFKAAHRYGRAGYQPGIAVGQVAREPLDRLVGLFGGTVCPVKRSKPHQSDSWLWQLAGAARMRRVLPELIPYLTVKRREAELTLHLANVIPPQGVYGHHRPLPPHIREQQDRAAAAIKQARQGGDLACR